MSERCSREMDDVLFMSCHSQFREEESRLSLVAEKRKEAWERLENAASHQPIARNTAILVTPLPVNTALPPTGKSPISIEGVEVFAMYLSESKKLVLSKPDNDVEISLGSLCKKLCSMGSFGLFA
ncbi:hypothetical protein Pint_26989 [Pistacia integerrima]|uniref:Uncharacterized protein n=1 Tax=Pistacia integerrima TaxID=434235 RepID=A0ACC0YS24_9ROSI|nr:hypothetical protein Pint_26989 [Pistacia integerrima]